MIGFFFMGEFHIGVWIVEASDDFIKICFFCDTENVVDIPGEEL